MDCVVEGRSESDARSICSGRFAERPCRGRRRRHPRDRDGILVPDKRTTFGVVEMTTGCGRRCQFCLPDLNPQMDVPKDRIMEAVHANVREGNARSRWRREDMFIWGQVHTDTPFYFPNREALLDSIREVVDTPGVEHHVLSHATIAPAVVDPVLIEQLSDVLPRQESDQAAAAQHPSRKARARPAHRPRNGIGTLAKQIMPSKGVPFPIDDWPSVVVEGLRFANANNWFPVMTLMIGSPGETDEDVKATLDLLYEVERRGLLRVFHSVDLHAAPRDAHGAQERRDRDAAAHAAAVAADHEVLEDEPAARSMSWWGPTAWRVGAVGLWALKLRKINGPNFTWPLLMFANAVPETVLCTMGKIHTARPLAIKTRKELLATIKPHQWQYLRADTGDVPVGGPAPTPQRIIMAQAV